jgi:hypothetical protein
MRSAEQHAWHWGAHGPGVADMIRAAQREAIEAAARIAYREVEGPWVGNAILNLLPSPTGPGYQR